MKNPWNRVIHYFVYKGDFMEITSLKHCFLLHEINKYFNKPNLQLINLQNIKLFDLIVQIVFLSVSINKIIIYHTN